MSGRGAVSLTVSVVPRGEMPEAVFALPAMTATADDVRPDVRAHRRRAHGRTSTRLIAAAIAAVSGFPFEKRKPLRMWNTYVRPRSSTSQPLAASGTTREPARGSG